MAYGRKRTRLGFVLLTISLAAFAGLIVSRWHEFRCSRFDGVWAFTLRLGQGRIWYSYEFQDPANPFPPMNPQWTVRLEPVFPPRLFMLDPDVMEPLDYFAWRNGLPVHRLWRLAWAWRRPGVDGFLTCVAWPFPLATSLIGSWLTWRGLRIARRLTSNHCPHCNYDRSATPPASPCPECGQVPPSPRAASAR
jgi:hypothetical protein